MPVGMLLTIAIIAISFAAIFVKWSEAPATILGMYRMYIASLLLFPIVWSKKEQLLQLSRKDWLFLSIAGFFLGIHFALWFGSLKLTTVASSTIILSLQPIIALWGGFLIYKEKANLSLLVPIGISIIGVSLVGWGDFGYGSPSAMVGNLLSLLSVIAAVVYLLVGQSKVKQISHWIYSFIVFLFAGFVLTIFNLLANLPIGGYPLGEWGIFLLLGIVPTISHVIFNFLLRYVNTTTISISILGEPVGATILAVILLGEQVIALQIIGGCIVLSGVFLFLHQQKKPVGPTSKPKLENKYTP